MKICFHWEREDVKKMSIDDLKNRIEEDKTKLMNELMELVAKHRAEEEELIKRHSDNIVALKDQIAMLNAQK
jgi:ribosomal protein L29